MKKIIFILFTLFITLGVDCLAQNKEFVLKINPVENSETSSGNIISRYSQFKDDSLTIINHAKQLLTDLKSVGFIASSVDTITFDSVNANVNLYVGSLYKINRINISGIDLTFDSFHDLKKHLTDNNSIAFAELQNIKENIVTQLENNGYPFAVITTDSIRVDNNLLSVSLKVNRGSFFTIDSVVIKGDSKIKPYFIKRYTGIKPGDPFSQRKINDIDNKINDLIFLSTLKPIELEFRDQQATIYLYLKNKRANQFNGIIGVIPESEKSGKLLITGDLQLFLANSFNRGEEIGLRWEKLESETQKLDIKFQYPYLFKSPFGLDMNFALYRQDSTFINLDYIAGVRWYASTNNLLRVFYKYKSSSIISTLYTANLADMHSSVIGASFNYKALDYEFNPRKGMALLISGGAGTKETTSFELADTSNRRNYTSVESELHFDGFYPIYGNFIFHFGNVTRYLGQFDDSGSKTIFYENEMAFFGGARSLRGFDENSFSAAIYSLQNIELRYLFEQNSAFYVFWNGAYYYKPMPSKTIEDFPWGVGVGINFDTRAGIFSISYAVGKQFDNPIEIQTAKIHVGYISRF